MADNVIDRSILRFAEAVKSSFSFLEAVGFCCVRSEATFVRFESEKMNIKIYHGRRSYEIDLEVEPAQSPAESYPLREILFIVDPKRAEQYKGYATQTQQGVVEGVRQLAEYFSYCLCSGILDDPSIFSQLRQQHQILMRDYWQKKELQQAIGQLELAWTKRDFQKVVKILSPLQEHLNLVDLKKLEYAKRHLKNQCDGK